MPWVRLEDDFADSIKFEGLSDSARWLWVAALAYSNRMGTDGRVPRTRVGKLPAASRYPLRCASELVRARLWHASGSSRCTSPTCPCSSGSSPGDDFIIHDYWQHQPSRAEVEEKREQKVKAGRAGGLAKAQRAASVPPTPGAYPDPGPTRPVPDRERDPGASYVDLTQLEAAGFKRYGALAGSAIATVRRLLPVTVDEFQAALTTGGASWGYAAKVIISYRQKMEEPTPPPAGNGRRRPNRPPSTEELLALKFDDEEDCPDDHAS